MCESFNFLPQFLLTNGMGRLINEYIPNRTPAEQLHLLRAHYTVKMTWRSVQIISNEHYFTKFVNALSNYTDMLSQIKHNIKVPIPALPQRYDF